MSLRCSLLGHSYGEAEIEREREEQGSEVVVTVREFEECERCNSRKVITENKEITALDSPAPDLESAESEAIDADVNATGSDGVGRDGIGNDGVENDGVEGDDAEILSDSRSSPDESGHARDSGRSGESNGVETADEPASPAVAASADDAQTASDDDGVILDDDGNEEPDDRQPGEWPDAGSTRPAETDETEYADWPDVGKEDEGFDAEPSGGESANVEFGGGLTPESAAEVDADEADEVEFVNAEGDTLEAQKPGGGQPKLSSGISAGAEAPSLSGPADDPDVDAEFVCPECDYRATVAGSSLRAGDICPECARGYLAQE